MKNNLHNPSSPTDRTIGLGNPSLPFFQTIKSSFGNVQYRFFGTWHVPGNNMPCSEQQHAMFRATTCHVPKKSTKGLEEKHLNTSKREHYRLWITTVKLFFVGATLFSTSACEMTRPPVEIDEAKLDATTHFIQSSEQGSYRTFFRPSVGFVGDPMPFFDPVAQTFRIPFLQDWRDGAPTFHPIHSATSPDASTFRPDGELVPCGTLDEQDPAIGTGSVVYAEGEYWLFYTGHKFNFTAGHPKEVVLLARSKDFKRWTKDRSFLLSAEEDYDRNEFRDPHVLFDPTLNQYRMLVSTIKNGRPVVAQYFSTDLRSWTLQQPLYTAPTNSFMECADLFQMGNYWYLTYSDQADRMTHYLYATSPSGPWNVGPDGGILDGTWFYAGKTAANATDRYLWGWCATRSGQTDQGVMDWAGSLVAHRLVQNPNGTLTVQAPAGLLAKYNKPLPFHSIASSGATVEADGYRLVADGLVRMTRFPMEGKLTFRATASSSTDRFGLLLGDASDRTQKYRLLFDLPAAKLLLQRLTYKPDNSYTAETLNQLPLTVPTDRLFEVVLCTERSVGVLHINGVQAFTNRIYSMPRNPWALVCEQGDVRFEQVWLMGL